MVLGHEDQCFKVVSKMNDFVHDFFGQHVHNFVVYLFINPPLFEKVQTDFGTVR